MDIVTKTFLFNLICIVIFSFIYMSISPNNFAALQPKDKITYIDLIFYLIVDFFIINMLSIKYTICD